MRQASVFLSALVSAFLVSAIPVPGLVQLSFHAPAFAAGSGVTYEVMLKKPNVQKTGAYVDQLISIKFLIGSDVNFVLENKTESPITIDWNKVSYIDSNRVSHRIIHKGVKFTNRNETMAQTIVPPFSKIEDLIFPADNVSYSEHSREWEESPIFPQDLSLAKLLVGSSFSVFMPLEIDGKVKNYFFEMEITSVKERFTTLPSSSPDHSSSTNGTSAVPGISREKLLAFSENGVIQNNELRLIGVGEGPANGTAAMKRLLGQRNAVVDGYKKLAETVTKIRVSESLQLMDVIVENDAVKSRVSAMIKQSAVVGKPKYMANGTVEIEVYIEGIADKLVEILR